MSNTKYFVYITTNPRQTILYVGVTNDLTQRMAQHYENKGKPDTFAGKYYCYNLIYYQEFDYIEDAIRAEKEIKDWSRQKKEDLIDDFNPSWKTLNAEISQFLG